MFDVEHNHLDDPLPLKIYIINLLLFKVFSCWFCLVSILQTNQSFLKVFLYNVDHNQLDELHIYAPIITLNFKCDTILGTTHISTCLVLLLLLTVPMCKNKYIPYFVIASLKASPNKQQMFWSRSSYSQPPLDWYSYPGARTDNSTNQTENQVRVSFFL